MALTEIGARQRRLGEAVTALQDASLDTVALDAFVHAMHRIRTNLDVALGCSEEAAELTDDDAVASACAQSAAALRLIYHYANEMNDLAAIRTIAVTQTTPDVKAEHLLADVHAALLPIARDIGVELKVVAGGVSPLLQCNRALVERVLTYLVLSSIVSSDVKVVRCDVVAHTGDKVVEFGISDNGRGVSLDERAASGTYGAMLDPFAAAMNPDATGFAVARRLARKLGGRLEIETAEGRGTRTMLFVPLRPDTDRSP
jgi:signal transduction histidine kinase